MALDDVDVAFPAGEFAAIMGPSGSGKSTLMHCLAGLDTPTAGQVFVGGTDLAALRDRALTRLRRDRVGFIFQSFNLLPTLSALENITLPADIAGRFPPTRPGWTRSSTPSTCGPGSGTAPANCPAASSSGWPVLERSPAAQRRSSPTNPPVTSTPATAADVLALLRRCVHELGQTIVMVTHDPAAASHADRAVFLADGRIVDELSDPTAQTVLERMTKFERAAAAVEAAEAAEAAEAKG